MGGDHFANGIAKGGGGRTSTHPSEFLKIFFFRFPWLGATRVAPSPDPDLRVGAEALARSLVESRPGGEMPSGVAVAASDWKSERLAVGASEAQHL